MHKQRHLSDPLPPQKTKMESSWRPAMHGFFGLRGSWFSFKKTRHLWSFHWSMVFSQVFNASIGTTAFFTTCFFFFAVPRLSVLFTMALNNDHHFGWSLVKLVCACDVSANGSQCQKLEPWIIMMVYPEIIQALQFSPVLSCDTMQYHQDTSQKAVVSYVKCCGDKNNGTRVQLSRFVVN